MCLCLVYAATEIYDPLNVFCGSKSCYDVLSIQRNASSKEVKKAFRQLSLFKHPDKNKEENATEVFRVISKAFEVLSGNESRPLFDYYLDHPRDYFKVSGEHYIKIVPMSDVRIVLLVVILLISWFFRTIQSQKYEKAVKYLHHATFNNLGLRNGGSRQTLELYRRASEKYDLYLKTLKGKAAKVKDKKKDPKFLEIVDEVVSDVKIEGGYRKPEWNDFFAFQLVFLPHTLFVWMQTYHRRYISKVPLALDEQLEMARDKVGLATWDEIGAEEQKNLVKRQIWLQVNYDAWLSEKEAEQLKKQTKMLKKKGRQTSDEDNNEYYVE